MGGITTIVKAHVQRQIFLSGRLTGKRRALLMMALQS
jgi:hypothetical protein